MLGVSERMALKPFGREIIFEEFQPNVIMVPKRCRQTDRRTDRRTDDLLSHHRNLLQHSGRSQFSFTVLLSDVNLTCSVRFNGYVPIVIA